MCACVRACVRVCCSCSLLDYMGNTSAQLLYHGLDDRWILPSRYYTTTVQLSEGSATFFFLDTNPFIEDYVTHPE